MLAQRADSKTALAHEIVSALRLVFELPPVGLEMGNFFVPSAELARHLAAVDQERRTRDVGGYVRREKHDGIGYFARLAAAPERNVAKILLEHGRIYKRVLGQRRSDQSWTNGVDADAVRTKLVGGGVQDAKNA